MGQMADPVEKRRRVELLRDEVRRGLADFQAPPGAPRVFTYPLEDYVSEIEDEVFYEMETMLPEERGTHLFVRYILEEVLGTTNPDEADCFFLPLYFPVHDVSEIELGPTIADLEFIGTGKKHILCSIWDIYPRPPVRRANPFCPVGQGILKRMEFIEGGLSWLDERFVLVTPECSIDLHPNDIGVLPLALPFEPGFDPADRPLLYSFCGMLHYDSMVTDHVRGTGNQPYWEALRRLQVPDVFIGSLDDARARFGSATTYRDLNRWSHFTLCPAGWARWSFRLTESLQAGSIPVILSDYYLKPFSAYVPWDRFALHLPESSLSRIDSVLRAFAVKKVAHLHRELDRSLSLLSIPAMARHFIAELSHRLGA